MMLMSVYRDADRLRPVLDDALAAEGIIVALLGVQPNSIRSAVETFARDDYWVDLDDAVVEAEPSWTYNGVLDVVNPVHGRITATMAPEEENDG